MTLDTYADLFDDDLDYVAQALSAARHHSAVRVLDASANHTASVPTTAAGIAVA